VEIHFQFSLDFLNGFRRCVRFLRASSASGRDPNTFIRQRQNNSAISQTATLA